MSPLRETHTSKQMKCRSAGHHFLPHHSAFENVQKTVPLEKTTHFCWIFSPLTQFDAFVFAKTGIWA